MNGVGEQHQEKPNVALIGLRGSGKTAVGRELASFLGGEHVDTDDLIVEQAGQSIAAIFENEGEPSFRRREREVIAQVVQSPPAVISVGGGAILDDENVRRLRSVAKLVWLTAPIAVLWQRIANDPITAGSRPALTDQSGRDELQQLLAARTPHYQRAADLTIDTTTKQPHEIAVEIAERLESGE